MQVGEHAFKTVVAQHLRAVQHVGLEKIAQARPVRRDQQAPALLKQVREHGAGRRRVV
jgi:hypothetical protein